MEIYGEYKIKDAAGSGGCGQVFLAVKANNDTDKKAYILKTVSEDSEYLEDDIQSLRNEIGILLDLNNAENPCPYIPNIYDSDKNNYKKEDNKECDENKIQEENIIKARPYYVTDYFTKQNLYYYVINMNNGFSETHVKVIFKKIVEAIKYCHDKNEIKNLQEDKGTEEYKCPEMWEKKIYSGEKADIFSLGAVLFNLVSGKNGFPTSKADDPIYSLIKKGEPLENYEKYWKALPDDIFIKLSENFKNLYIKMVSYNPKNRPTAQQILENPWFDEINNLSDENKKKLDDEVKQELDKIYEIKIRFTPDDDLILSDNIAPQGYNTRGIDDDVEEYFFNKNLRAKKIPNDKISINQHIILKGGYLEERSFMNHLCEEIDHCEKLRDVTIFPSENNLKFKLYFGENEKEKFHKQCVINIELFQYEDGRYLLEFLRRSGEIPDYYQNFLIIKDIIKNKINNLI